MSNLHRCKYCNIEMISRKKPTQCAKCRDKNKYWAGLAKTRVRAKVWKPENKEAGLKECSTCKNLLSVSLFYTKGIKNGKQMYSAHCKECCRINNSKSTKLKEYQREWVANNKDKVRCYLRTNRINIRSKHKRLTIGLCEKLLLEEHCIYCNVQCIGKDKTLDHLIPLAKGGDNSEANLVMACRSCNSRKHKRDLQDFLTSWFSNEQQKEIYQRITLVHAKTDKS